MDGLLSAPVRWGDEVKTVREWIESDKCVVPPEVALLRLSAGQPIDFACTAEVVVPLKITQHEGKGSRFHGVYVHGDLWLVQVYANGKRTFIGKYNNETVAAAAYNIAARVLLRGRERLNIM